MELVVLNGLARHYLKQWNQQPETPPVREPVNISPVDTPNLTNVDKKTWDMLALADDAIRHTHQVLPKGSSNQKEHLLGNNRAGKPNDGKIFGLDNHVKLATDKLVGIFYCGTELDEAQYKFRFGISAAVSRYYQGGNCTAHAAVAINYLLEHSPPGTKIMYFEATEMDHVFVCIESINDSGQKFHVICDPYPANNPQVVLLEDYFISPGKMNLLAVPLEVTEKNRGINFMDRFFMDGFNTPEGREAIIEALAECTTTQTLPSFKAPWVKKEIEGKACYFSGIHATKNNEFHEYVSGNQKLSELMASASMQQPAKIPGCPLKTGKKGIEPDQEYVIQSRLMEQIASKQFIQKSHGFNNCVIF